MTIQNLIQNHIDSNDVCLFMKELLILLNVVFQWL